MGIGQGAWRVVLERTRGYMRSPRDEILTNATWCILALTKLQQYTTAAEELASLGNLDSQPYGGDTFGGGFISNLFCLGPCALCQVYPARLHYLTSGLVLASL
jgi:hypothetical protein